MENIRVYFVVKIDNPEYRYGDQDKSMWKTIEGKGTILKFMNNRDGNIRAIVLADKGNDFDFYEVELYRMTYLTETDKEEGN